MCRLLTIHPHGQETVRVKSFTDFPLLAAFKLLDIRNAAKSDSIISLSSSEKAARPTPVGKIHYCATLQPGVFIYTTSIVCGSYIPHPL